MRLTDKGAVPVTGAVELSETVAGFSGAESLALVGGSEVDFDLWERLIARARELVADGADGIVVTTPIFGGTQDVYTKFTGSGVGIFLIRQFAAGIPRDLIEAEATRNKYVLVPEPARANGNVVSGVQVKAPPGPPAYQNVFGETLAKLADADPKICAITAANLAVFLGPS